MEIIQNHRSAEEVVWDSYGTPLERLRRIQLWRLAEIHKVAFPPGANREIMLRLLGNKQDIENVDVMKPPQGMTEDIFWKLINGPSKKYNELGGASQTGNTNVDVMRDILEGRSHFETEEEPVQTDYAGFIAGLSWGELKTEAKNQGLTVPNSMKRPQLEAVLLGKDAP